MYKIKSPSSNTKHRLKWLTACNLGYQQFNKLRVKKFHQANHTENEMPILHLGRAPDKVEGASCFETGLFSILLHFFNSVIIIVCIFLPSRTLPTVAALKPGSRSRPSSDEGARERATQRCSIWGTSTKAVGEAVVPAMPATQEPTSDTCTISLLSQIAVSLTY
jgi:hypothetical protein